MKKPLELTEIQRGEMGALAGRYGLSLLVLFGSQATGHAGPESDVDLGFVAAESFPAMRIFASTLTAPPFSTPTAWTPQICVMARLCS